MLKCSNKKRRTLNLSQEVLAEKLGPSMRSISLFECGKQEPLLSSICCIAKALEISATELMCIIEKDLQNQSLVVNKSTCD
ncbi:transcriptional regulator, XRE family [Abyssogena phaseoliformis symbiont OG214]|nr:transcriptional regulator, XRE family [Abyssogena phaseoliformis symbiont OG214]